jgi:hypothetical protein
MTIRYGFVVAANRREFGTNLLVRLDASSSSLSMA